MEGFAASYSSKCRSFIFTRPTFIVIIQFLLIFQIGSCLEHDDSGPDSLELETDHCLKHLYTSLSPFPTVMEFTKEATSEEFAIKGKFKGLHCCAKGYQSIEWLKDNRPYPWPTGSVSGLILYPASANQTVYTHNVVQEDAGNYTCLIKNDTHVYTHTIQLIVYDKAPDEPKVTYLSNDQEIQKGNPVRLFCEAFVGQMDLPDAHNEAVWLKVDENGTLAEILEEHIKHETVSREENQTFGSYVTIDSISEDDFGTYVCKITKFGSSTLKKAIQLREKIPVVYLVPNPFPLKKLLTIICILTVVVSTLILLYVRHGLKLRVQLKDQFGTQEFDELKTKDALIVYSELDADLVLGVLLPTLEQTYGYMCSAKELKPSQNDNFLSWTMYLTEPARKCSTIIAVLSPSLVGGTNENNWDSSTLQKAIKQLSIIGTPLILVTLKQLPSASSQTKDHNGETLSSMLKTTHVVPWTNQSNEQKFWLSLRLRLPCKRMNTVKTERERRGTIVRQTSDNNMMVDLCSENRTCEKDRARNNESIADFMV